MANQADASVLAFSASDASQPRVRRGAKALIASSERVLLVKERHADGSPFWTLPGGGVYAHESLTDGLRRELREELHCQSLVEDATLRVWYAHISLPAVSLYTVFRCSLLSDVLPDRDEGILASRWVEPTNPPQSTLPQVRYVLRETAVTDAD